MVMAKCDRGIQGTVVYGNKLESAVGSSGEGCDGELLLPRVVEGKTQERAYSEGSCLTLLGPHGLQPARLLVHGILQAKILEWVAIPFPRGSS